MSAIAELEQDRVVEAVYAVAKKERLRTKGGAPYLALELVDPSGRIEAGSGTTWSYSIAPLRRRRARPRPGRPLPRQAQLDVRSLELPRADPAALLRAATRRRRARRLPRVPRGRDRAPGTACDCHPFRRRHGLSRSAAKPARHHRRPSLVRAASSNTQSAWPPSAETAQLPRLRSDLLLTAAVLHDAGRTLELTRGPVFRPTDEGRLLGHVHLGLRLIETRAAALEGVRAELLHAVAVHHDAAHAEAAVLYHANQLDAVAATRRQLARDRSCGSGQHHLGLGRAAESERQRLPRGTSR